MQQFLSNVNRHHLIRALAAGLLLLAAVMIYVLQAQTMEPAPQTLGYASTPQANHQQVRATIFWIGEPANHSNRFIHNRSSAWVSDWVGAFGGNDDPRRRCGHGPCGFTPRENPFYFALPFNDYTPEGKLKPEAVLRRIPWYDGRPLPKQSLLKNQWIAVTYQGKTAYAQWQDVGPFGEDDADYVFGDQPPAAGVGLDLSPATAGYLGVDGDDLVSWQFVEPSRVPDGPWKAVITTSGLRH